MKTPDKKQSSGSTSAAVETPPPPQHMDPSKMPVPAKRVKKPKRVSKR